MELIPYPEMSVSELYLKMCHSAGPILREFWEPQKGDRVICGCKSCYLELRNVYFIQDYQYDALTKRDLTNVVEDYAKMIRYFGDDFVSHYNECRELFVWLPYQHQIQQLTGLTFQRMLRMFKTYLAKIDKNKFVFDFDCMWLDFLMEFKGYKWDMFKSEWRTKSGS